MITEKDIVAYIGTIWDFIGVDSTEEEIRDIVKKDISMMDEELKAETEEAIDEIIAEALRELKGE